MREEGNILIEFYEGDDDKHTATVRAPCVPRAGEYISIRKQAWQVTRVTWCVDHADELGRALRACVVLEPPHER